LGSVGLSEQALGARRLPLDLATYCSLMELAAQETQNSNFGLWFGQQFQPEALGLIGDIALASPTVGAAFENLCTLFPYHQQATQTRCWFDGSLMHLDYQILDGQIIARRQDAELTMGMFVNLLRRLLGATWGPEEIHFEHPRPEAANEHQRAFGAAVYFGQPTNGLLFRPPDFQQRIGGGDLVRLTQLRAELTALTGGPGNPSLLSRTKGEIRRRLTCGAPQVEQVANALGLPRWTLQRRLADQGLTFSQAVEQVRQDLSRLYLAQSHIPLADIAQALGYSEVSAFTRAVKRWSGTSPARLRRNLVR
jgi:AraC-like DNA-binding protein